MVVFRITLNFFFNAIFSYHNHYLLSFTEECSDGIQNHLGVSFDRRISTSYLLKYMKLLVIYINYKAFVLRSLENQPPSIKLNFSKKKLVLFTSTTRTGISMPSTTKIFCMYASDNIDISIIRIDF